MHLWLEAANEGEAGLSVGKPRDAVLDVEEPVDEGVNVSRLLEIGEGGTEVEGIVAVCVPVRKDLHEGIVEGGSPLGGCSRSPVLKEGEGSSEFFLRGELFGVVDGFQLAASFSEVVTHVISGRLELESGAGRFLGLQEGGGELEQGLGQLLVHRRGRRMFCTTT